MKRTRRAAAVFAGALAAAGIAIAAPGCALTEHAKGGKKARGVEVVRAVDGDTIVVQQGGSEQSVRLIGIDTPETVKRGEPVECGGPEASAAMKRMASPGDRVKLVSDPTQDSVDQYGRLLRYVEERGRDLGRAQLKAGNAAVYVYDVEFRRVGAYREAEASAKQAGRGTWGECGGF